MPTETAEVQLPEVKAKAFDNKPVPDEALKTDFSLDNFEVEQLPEQETKEESSDDLKSKAEEAAKQTTQEALKKAVEAPAKKEPSSEEETQEEEVKQEEKKPAIKSVLKPPQKKEEVKAGEKQDTKQETKPILPPEKKKVVRDYAGYSDEQVRTFKQMSDEAYSYVTNLLKETDNLKKNTYLQHPEAYKLSPEYSQNVTSYQRADWESRYWESQLEAIEAGKPIKPFQGWDNKTGQPVFGDDIQPTKAIENKIQQAILACTTEARRLQGEVRQYPQRYKTQTAQELNNVEDWRKQNFGWNSDESLLDHSVEIEGLGDRTLKQIKEDVNTMVPSFLHSSPLHPVVQDLAIAVRILQAEKASLMAELGTKTTIKEEKELVEPNGKGKQPDKRNLSKVNGMTEFSVDPELGI